MPQLYRSWRAAKDRLKQSSAELLAEFNRQLVRRLSVETGILERLYDLDRGTTEALVANGFLEDLVSRSSTNIDPGHLVEILRDQEAAVQLVIDTVTHNRELTKGLLHELHVTLTRHQDSTTAVDQFGARFEIPLLKGKFKEWPNNPKRADGAIHEYCPPIHVDSEIDNLLQWLAGYDGEDPIIVAAWLHHRFTQIHPYQDGNGRVARALTTLVLLRAGLLPSIVDRDERTRYIGALEAADGSELSDLVEIFSRLERAAMLQALSIDTHAGMAIDTVATAIESLAEKIQKRRQAASQELREVNGVALELRTVAHGALAESLARLEMKLMPLGQTLVEIVEGGSDRGDFDRYKTEALRAARERGIAVNFSEHAYYVHAEVLAGTERLSFTFSFHHVGHELTGIMEVMTLSDPERRAGAQRGPFVFTHESHAADIARVFRKWVDGELARAIKEFGDRL